MLENANPVTLSLFSGLFTWAVTTLGSSSVFLLRTTGRKLNELMLGFAAGVMTAASIWSLILPALDMSREQAIFRWLPVTVGFVIGTLFMRVIDYFLPHLHPYFGDERREGLGLNLRKSTLLFLAITLHNIPEGLVMGVAYSAAALDQSGASYSSAIALAIGIGVQNFPEGMAVSFPLNQSGLSKMKSFFYGQASGIVEPIFAMIGALATSHFASALPYVLGFAAGTMMFVVIEELIPEAQSGQKTDLSTLGFAGGFLFMMILDVGLEGQ